MKRKYCRIAKTFAGGLVVLGIAASSNAVASHAPENGQGLVLGKGWVLNSTGGLTYIDENRSDYWFKLNGLLRFDEVFFMGSYRDKGLNYPNGGNIRTADVYAEGGVGEDWSYKISLQFAPNNPAEIGTRIRINRPSFSDTWIAYSGFADNNQVFVGRVPGNWFGLDNANSGTWGPFLERSLVANTFYPGDGIGFMTDFWNDCAGITFTAMKSDQTSFNEVSRERDRWKGTVRATVAPVHEAGDVWHFGISGAYRELRSTVSGAPADFIAGNGAGFSTYPGVKIRNSATGYNSVVNTFAAVGGIGGAPTPIQANNIRMFNVEMARQIGPFMLEGEYTNVFVHRMGTQTFTQPPGTIPATVQVSQGSLRFSGWNIQTRYMLTGEEHAYDVRDGGFGSVKPCSEYGAFEVAARYDFVDLNDKNVPGGSQHDVTLGLNWFLNQQVRFSVNYIRASMHPANNLPRRNLDIIGLRAQVRFN